MDYTKEKKEFEREFVQKGDFKPEVWSWKMNPDHLWNWITQVFAKRVERKLIKKIEKQVEALIQVRNLFKDSKEEYETVLFYLNQLKNEK